MFKNISLNVLFWIGIIILSLNFSSCQTNDNEIKQNTESKLLKDEIILDSDLNKEIDLEDNKQNFETFMKIRSSIEAETSSINQTKESIYYWEGSIYSFINGKRSKKIMGMKGFNISRWSADSAVQLLLTREVALYTDPKTGKIMEKMKNPLLDENSDSLEVIHVWNDPVNQRFPYNIKENYEQKPTESTVYSIPYSKLGEDMVCFYADIFLTYPSKITRKEFPQNVQSDLYQGAELFQFFVRKNDLENPMLTDIPATISWTRIGQWLPFMNMGNTEGNLVYQCRGYKVLEGFEGLPQDVKDYVRAKEPIFEHAPTKYSEPNETSWSYFKKIKENGN
ncbi:Protein of unknown function (DUF1838) [Bernardetia litoralis DSM 6794]|uniref:DUF1838 domain-containing protein n=1 Tax=Bernardetia litoralis (strain ATCC 23117 / DSM 6794 / NBRC 15988 / NCIMB 1366 / Fx l1 / Sio-4) TaxID=880071 RepID=I4AI99_BERLS|nr:DUF1838 domain-containing protein [Bernardetia litoralis]AFM03684.1 Protein of unknown function (DUF1838) [Bernardetia litoralis DSM 6794]